MGEREITARSDVYALGCVTYEMLVGDPPFTGSTAQAIIAKVMTEKPVSAPAAAGARARRGGGRRPHRAREAAGRSVRQRGASSPRRSEARRAPHARASAPPRGAPGAPRSRLRDPVVLGLGAIAIAAALLAAWSRRTATIAPAPVVRFTLPAAPSGRTSSLGYNSPRGLARRSLPGLPRPGRRPPPAADVPRAWTTSCRGRCRAPRTPAIRSFRPTANGSPSSAATSSTRSPSTGRRRSCSGRRRARSMGSAGRRPECSSSPATRRCTPYPREVDRPAC